MPDLIVKTPGTCGGRARLDGTRMPVWCLVTYWLGGMSDEELRTEFGYTQEQLDAAKRYADDHWHEIQQDLKEQEIEPRPGFIFDSTGIVIVKDRSELTTETDESSS